MPTTSLGRGTGLIGDRDNQAGTTELRVPPAPSGVAVKVQGQQEQPLLCGITWGWRVWPGAEEDEKGKDAKTQE